MTPSQQRRMLALVVLVAGLNAHGAAAYGGKVEPLVVKQVPGKVKNLDLGKGVVTLLLGADADGAGMEKAFSLSAKEVPVTTDVGEKPKLAEVKPGLEVRLGLSGADDVVQVHVVSPKMKATIKAIDFEQQTLTLAGGKQDPGRKLKLAKDVKIEMGKETLEARDLFSGMRALLILSLDEATVHRMTASFTPTSDELRAAVVKVDPAAHTVRLLTATRFTLVTFPVAKDFHLIFNKKLTKAKLEDLPGVMHIDELPRALPVTVLFDEAGKTIITIVANPPRLTGVVQKVDAATGGLTVKTEKGVETFTVQKNAEIKVKGAGKNFADIKPGAAVDVFLGLNRSEVVAITSSKVAEDADGAD